MTDNLYDLVSVLLISTNSQTTLMDTATRQYRFMPEAGASLYDVTIAHEGPSPTFAFTLTALSNCNVRILDGPPPMPYKVEVSRSAASECQQSGAHHERTALCFLRSEEPGQRPLLVVTTLAIPSTAIRSICSSLARRFLRRRNNNGSKSLRRQTRRRRSTSGYFTQTGNESTSKFFGLKPSVGVCFQLLKNPHNAASQTETF